MAKLSNNTNSTNTNTNTTNNISFDFPSTPTMVKDVDYFISKKGTPCLKVVFDDDKEILVCNKYDICNILKNVLANCSIEPVVYIEDKVTTSNGNEYHNANVLIKNQ